MIAALFAALALAGADLPAPDARTVPADRVFVYWGEYHALPEDERSAFTLRYELRAERAPGGEARRFWTRLEGEDWRALEPGPDGAVAPPAPDRLATGLQLATDAPQGSVGVSLQLSLTGVPSQTYDLAHLAAGVAQARAVMRQVLGVRALIAPRPRRVDFVFDGPAPDAFAVFPDGREIELTRVFESVVEVDPGARELRGAQTIRFGRAPLYARIVAAN